MGVDNEGTDSVDLEHLLEVRDGVGEVVGPRALRRSKAEACERSARCAGLIQLRGNRGSSHSP